MGISNRLPKTDQIHAVYGLAVLFIYGWTIYWFIWNLPSWLYFLTPGEIFALLCYSFAVNFFETFCIIAFFLIFSVILPSKWLREDFVFRASVTMIVVLSLLMYLLANFIHLDDAYRYALYAVVVLVVSHWVLGRIRYIRLAVEGLAERSTVFTYLTVPASILSLIVVAIRNL